MSIFNFIPDVYTKDDEVEVTFDPISVGSQTTSKSPNDITEEDLNKMVNDGIARHIDIDLDLTNEKLSM